MAYIYKEIFKSEKFAIDVVQNYKHSRNVMIYATAKGEMPLQHYIGYYDNKLGFCTFVGRLPEGITQKTLNRIKEHFS